VSTSPQLEPSWLAVLGDEFEKPYMADLKAFLTEERAAHQVFPPGREMFAAFSSTPFDATRVVILGQDPYHGPGQANGLCFSVKRGVRIPPSLKNILLEINDEIGIPQPTHGDLTHWAEQGVLLLNTVLSVRARTANSHRRKGWEQLTDAAIEALADHKDGLVFVLWGSAARKKARMIDKKRHLILESVHPSPLSAHRGFLGCGHFATINEWLTERGETPIDWALPA
jgi:uracil-DNA glycosylase